MAEAAAAIIKEKQNGKKLSSEDLSKLNELTGKLETEGFLPANIGTVEID